MLSRIRWDKIDGLVRVDDVTRYLALFRSEKYHYIYNRSRYLISVKSDFTDIISHNYAKINSSKAKIFEGIFSLCWGVNLIPPFHPFTFPEELT